ncbi:phosphate transporter [Acetobacter cibinongensis]|uniref:Phosphate transporter n=1 Tax=Acetobacter cibinongensis TaxID=146475 RepID=A0A0D6N0N4_9PROT|nr:inorganic phosphate transporter [Acetobacter cibinongensis]GAN59081.1 inorganic phosphate low-affinity transporter [Acetobacter cibinongensis]GBQ19638.1 inorganic phosphate low-affinity transporter [Acetobacter cibinongensis NRIC 0482]GEL58945.1 phosphate transporter [Acetobacter cibinongensis]
MSETMVSAGAQSRPNMGGGEHQAFRFFFLAVIAAALSFVGYSVLQDLHQAGAHGIAVGAFALLALALLIALGFEFVNGFHDTANAVATVIYTNSLPPLVAVVWSGACNLLGVLVSSGAVAYSVVTLLPVELILQVGSGAGHAMIFALLLSAILWNLATWAMGIPNSSSHALVGSILGVGFANQLMSPTGSALYGVDWSQVRKVFSSLLFSPICGFILAAGLLLVFKLLIKNPALYKSPEGDAPPPLWIRGLLVGTCTGVSFFHGSNDGQKGMGLIMLILIGAAPTAYALNRAMPESAMPAFVQTAEQTATVFRQHAPSGGVAPSAVEARSIVTDALREKSVNRPLVYSALGTLSDDIAESVKNYRSLHAIPAAAVPNVRTDMYLVSDAIRTLGPANDFSGEEGTQLKSFMGLLNAGTRFIPTWVKISVALALGLGTMVGWKRIVVTVGEKIGKTHLTYAQGASAEIVAMGTIGLAEGYGMPVSTTHILSSGVAGTMVAGGGGLQMSTLRSMAMAWIITLPAAMLISGILYMLFRHVF